MTESMFISSTPLPPQENTKNVLSYLVLTVTATSFLIGTVLSVFIIPNKETALLTEAQSNQLPNLMTDCKFFYQLCGVSSEGRTTPRSVPRALQLVNSPLLFLPIVEGGTTADSFITATAVQSGLNPFILLTLTELEHGTVLTSTTPTPIDFTVFQAQMNKLTATLLSIAKETQFAPENVYQPHPGATLQVGTVNYVATPQSSHASLVVLKYLAQTSPDQARFLTQSHRFTQVYQLLSGIDPRNDELLTSEENVEDLPIEVETVEEVATESTLVAPTLSPIEEVSSPSAEQTINSTL